MNTLLAELVDSPTQRAFCLAKSATLPPYCRECPVKFARHAGCPKHRFLQTPHGEPGLNYHCAGYKKSFKHIAPAMQTADDGGAARVGPRARRNHANPAREVAPVESRSRLNGTTWRPIVVTG